VPLLRLSHTNEVAPGLAVLLWPPAVFIVTVYEVIALPRFVGVTHEMTNAPPARPAWRCTDGAAICSGTTSGVIGADSGEAGPSPSWFSAVTVSV